MIQHKHVVYSLLLLVNSFIFQAKAVEIDNITFKPTPLNVGAGQPAITVLDFNSDGAVDVIFSSYTASHAAIYQGNGRGGLAKVGSVPVGENPADMAVADLNKDDNADLVVANHETAYVTLLLGDGKGGFQPSPQSPLKIDVKPHIHVVKLADLDSDNRVDLIVDSRDDNGMRYFKGLANGSFTTPGQLINAGGDPYRGFAIGDINGDGRIDMVTPNPREIGIVTHTGSNSPSFTLKKLAPYVSPFVVELAEMNGDGKLDMLVGSNGSSVTVIPGNGDGTFNEANKTAITTPPGAKQIAVGDINDDGLEDALVANWSGELLAVLGNKTKVETIRFKDANIPNPWGVALADLNGDGNSDLIIADGDSKAAVVYLSQTE
ncbi:VCBS repeat-containing protein [uncultured Microbulbifer sp.]|uniref:FG-GAP repeat domain-containing protein n=1 Tax=uncultured Microbulbifer sp. TaxID=348147 RepID=UPI00262492BC|nr:VCBS repeat-containing protein [uncultured Microbulbifer sp.]